jgi:hypothetical protein
MPGFISLRVSKSASWLAAYPLDGLGDYPKVEKTEKALATFIERQSGITKPMS